MTIIAAVRYKNHLILAADGQATSSKDYIENHKCRKIEELDDVIIAGAGSCSSTPILKRALLTAIAEVYDDNYLDIALASQPTLLKDNVDESVGEFLVLKKNDEGLISHFFWVEIGNTISVQNLFAEGQDTVAIGCGSPLFRAAFEATPSTTLAEIKLAVMTAMVVTAELSPYCNDVIDMRIYKVGK